jgi:hypothetical protein
MKKKPWNKEIKAYAGFDDRGNLLYATIKPTQEEASLITHRFNPPVKGFSYPFKVLPIYIGVDLNTQNSFKFEEE